MQRDRGAGAATPNARVRLHNLHHDRSCMDANEDNNLWEQRDTEILCTRQGHGMSCSLGGNFVSIPVRPDRKDSVQQNTCRKNDTQSITWQQGIGMP